MIQCFSNSEKLEGDPLLFFDNFLRVKKLLNDGQVKQECEHIHQGASTLHLTYETPQGKSIKPSGQYKRTNIEIIL